LQGIKMNMKTSLEKNMAGRGTFGDGIRRSAKRLKNKTHIVFYDHNKERSEFTYEEVNEKANKVAHAMIEEFGVGKGDKVAIISHNIPHFMFCWFGLTKIGAVVTAVNFSYNREEVSYQINHVEPKVFIVEDSLIDLIDPIKKDLNSVEHFIGVSLTEKDIPSGWMDLDNIISGNYSTDEPEVELDDTDLAMLVYTSGTESRPKGVMIQHRNYLSGTIPGWIRDVKMEESDTYFFCNPFYTISGIGTFTLCSILGLTLILSYHLIPEDVLKMIENEKVTLIGQTPTFYIKLSQADGFKESNIDTLKKFLVYGGLIPRGMIEDWHKKNPNLRWGTYWGQSELSQLGSVGWFNKIEDIPDEDPSWIGKPVFTLETKVIDGEGKEIRSGVGELCCRGASVMMGYFKDEAKTSETMNGGWIHTGDQVRINEDGHMFFFDRKKDVIKTGGMNVSSFEVQDAINQHPAVLEVAVIGLKDEFWSERVTAFVITQDEAEVSEEDIKLYCKSKLAPYKVPKQVVFVKDFPRDNQGKLLKRELRDTHQEPIN
jgi:acyl-CoA synthetase (AMP-forming)/AMP-acid ligase II